MKTTEPPILCGTDLSENAAQVATVAAALAARAGKPLMLVHVADEFNARGDDKEKLAAFLRPVRKQLAAEAERLRKAGATVEVKLLTGSLAERAILELVEMHPSALVVVSSVSKTAFDRWTLGSVSEKLAESVASPTLVVRSAAPFEAWMRGERSLKVFVAADFTSVSEAAIQWAGDLRRLGPCNIVVAHLDRPQEERKRLGFPRRIAFHENPPEVQRLLERDLREKVGVWLGEENIRMVVEPVVDRPDARLIELAAEAQADLIVVGTHQRHRLGGVGHASVSRGILRHAPMSVVCVPAATFAKAGTRVPEIQRVLVATDFSELGNRAVPHAYSLLREGGTVFLLHITHPMPLPNPLSRDLGSKMDQVEKDEAARLHEAYARLQALIPIEAEKRGVASEVASVEHSEPKELPHVGMYYGIIGEVHVIEDTDPARAICQAAERFGAEVICLGSHGRSGLSAVLMGSVAQAVMAQSHRPVLVVRPPVE